MNKKNNVILGINSVYHECSACIIINGKIIAAIEEERLTRIKRAKEVSIHNGDYIPWKSIEWCMKEANVKWEDITYITCSFNPELRLKEAEIIDGNNKEFGFTKGEDIFLSKVKDIPDIISKKIKIPIYNKFYWIPHHISHAMYSIGVSNFNEMGVIVADGIGEGASTSIGFGNRRNVTFLKEIHYPDSLGLTWEKINRFLGLSNYDSGKVMSLSSYYNNNFNKKINKLFNLKNGRYRINNNILELHENHFKKLEKYLNLKSLKDNNQLIKKEYQSISKSLQKNTEKVIIYLINNLYKQLKLENLVCGGGLFLNCLLNSKILEKTKFKNLDIPPATNDAGTAIGAAWYIYGRLVGPIPIQDRNIINYSGPKYKIDEIKRYLDLNKVEYIYEEDNKKLLDLVSDLILKNKIIGWFDGRMEFGPRALGHRSILANPFNDEVINRLFKTVKVKRFKFQSFAPMILEDEVNTYFNKMIKSPIYYRMLGVYYCKDKYRKKLKNILHNDNSSRVQLINKENNYKLYYLLKKIKKKINFPILINTSFNQSGEPIVCSPKDAINTFLKTGIDILVIENFIIFKKGEGILKK